MRPNTNGTAGSADERIFDNAKDAPHTDGRFVGVDVGGTAIKWSLVEHGSVVDEGSVPTPRESGAALADQIVSVVQSAGRGVSGTGLALPGLIDSVGRRVLFTPNLSSEWTRSSIVDDIEKRTGVPISLLNDAHAFAYGEHLVGAGAGEPAVLFITLGTGVGGGIALDGEILTGRSTSIGSIGHYVVDSEGELCRCGGRGCLETVAAAPAVVGSVMRAMLTSQSTLLEQLTGGDPAALTARLVAQAADAGDPWAIAAFVRAGRALGCAAASICVFLQVTTVVVGGGLSGALGHIMPSLDDVLQQRTLMTGPITVRPAQLGPGAGSVGAALFAAAQSELSAPATQS